MNSKERLLVVEDDPDALWILQVALEAQGYQVSTASDGGEALRESAEQLLQALNQAALAMEQALTREEIFAAVAEKLKKLGLSCMVLLTDESQSRLFPKYLSYESGALKAVEKLVSLKIEDFSIPIETVDVHRKVVWGRKTVFVERWEEALQQTT